VADILRASLRNNALDGLTGALVVGRGTFVQMLGGD
jgi:hypothetical protein